MGRGQGSDGRGLLYGERQLRRGGTAPAPPSPDELRRAHYLGLRQELAQLEPRVCLNRLKEMDLPGGPVFPKRLKTHLPLWYSVRFANGSTEWLRTLTVGRVREQTSDGRWRQRLAYFSLWLQTDCMTVTDCFERRETGADLLQAVDLAAPAVAGDLKRGEPSSIEIQQQEFRIVAAAAERLGIAQALSSAERAA